MISWFLLPRVLRATTEFTPSHPIRIFPLSVLLSPPALTSTFHPPSSLLRSSRGVPTLTSTPLLTARKASSLRKSAFSITNPAVPSLREWMSTYLFSSGAWTRKISTRFLMNFLPLTPASFRVEMETASPQGFLPSEFSLSSRRVAAPSSAALLEAISPAGPAPTTITS